MTLSPEQSPAKSKNFSARRSKRVNLAIPIILSGTDSSGNPFQESTRTIIVSKHGAKIKAAKELALGALVTIENQSLGLATKATVISIGKRQYRGDPVEVGVQLTQAGNVWGIIFPPDDWEGEPLETVAGAERGPAPYLVGSAAGDPSPRTAAAMPTPSAHSSQGSIPSLDDLTLPPAEPAPNRGATPPASPREKIDAITTAVAAKLTKQLDEAADARLKAYAEKVIRFTNQFALRVQANFQEAANRTEDQMVVLIQQKLGTLVDRVQTSRTALESLLVRFESLQNHSRTLIEDTDQKIREASHQALESALQELAVKLRQGVEVTSSTLESECQALVLDAVTRTVNETLAKADDQLAVQTKDRLAKTYAELKWQQDQMIDGVKEQLNQIALSGTTNLSAKFETMAAELVPALRTEMEGAVRESAGQVISQSSQSLQQQTQVLTQDTLVSLQQAAQGLQDRMQEESRKVRHSAEQEMSKMAEAFSQSVAQRAEIAIGAVQAAAEQGASKLKTAQLESAKNLRAGVEDYQRQLVVRSGSALEGFQSGLQNLTRDLQEGAAQSFSQKLQGLADELAEASGEKARQQIQQEAAAAAEKSSKESRKRLSEMVDDFFVSSAKELQERLRSQGEAELDAVLQSAPAKFNERLGHLTHEAGLTLVKTTESELKTIADTLLQSSSESLHKQVGQLTDKLQNGLTTFQAVLADKSRKQLLAMSRSTIDALNQQASTGLEAFRTRLHKTTQESHEESLAALETSFQEALEKQRAAISAALQQKAEQSRDLAELQIKTMGEQMVAKAVEALDRQVAKSNRTIAETGEQTRAGVEKQAQKIELQAQHSIEEYQRHLENASVASLDKFRKDTGTLLDEVVFRLQQSVRSFQSATSAEILAELQKASDNLLEVSAAQMRKQTEQTLELITERLKEKEEEVVSDAANVFRSRIAEIFTVLQAGPAKKNEPREPE